MSQRYGLSPEEHRTFVAELHRRVAARGGLPAWRKPKQTKRIVHFENRGTSYTTESLKRFFEAGCVFHGVHDLKLVCVTSPGRTRGCATTQPGVNEMVIQIASPSRMSVKKLARIFEHELHHTQGVQHEDMSEEDYWSQGPEPIWARGLSLTLKSRNGKRTRR